MNQFIDQYPDYEPEHGGVYSDAKGRKIAKRQAEAYRIEESEDLDNEQS